MCTQEPLTVLSSVVEWFRLTVKRRKLGQLVASAISALAFRARFSGNTMLDWPV